MAAITTAAIGTGLGLVQTLSNANQKKDDKNALNNYDRTDVSSDANPYRNVQLSTVGSDLAREESQRTTATSIDALRGGGIRGVLGGLPQIVAANNDVNRKIQLDLDRQNQERQMNIARGEEVLMGVRENRDIQNLNNISQSYNSANQDMWSGISGMASGLTSIGTTVSDRLGNDQNWFTGKPN